MTNENVAKISILANSVLAGGKITIGIISNSSAILADGIHSLMDIFSSAIGYIGIKISKKPEDQKHPYGHYKFEVLGGFFITLILFGTGLGIVYDAYLKFLHPSLIDVPILAFGIMIFSAIINEIMARIKIYFGKKGNSISLLSDGIHSRVDVYASLAIFIGLFFTRYWIYADSFLAGLIGLYIIKESFSLGKEAVDSLLDTSAGLEIEEKIKEIIKNQNIELDYVKTQKKGSIITADLKIKLSNNLSIEEASKISDTLREKLMANIENLSYVTIQITNHDVDIGYYKPTFGKGIGWKRQGRIKNKITEKNSDGFIGYCVCPKCGYSIPHQLGIPCSTMECPNCHISLNRK